MDLQEKEETNVEKEVQDEKPVQEEPAAVLSPESEGVQQQVWSLSSFKVSRQLLTNYLNQVSSVSWLRTSSMALANEGLLELTQRPSLAWAVLLSFAKTTKGVSFCFISQMFGKTQVRKKCECCYLTSLPINRIHTFSELEFSEYLGNEAKGHTFSKQSPWLLTPGQN